MENNHPEWQYLNTLKEIINVGERVPNRTGVDTLRILGVTHRYNFKDGFPLLTTKKVYWKGVVHELLWFLKGSTNIKYLVDNGVNIWNDDAYRWYVKSVHGYRMRALDKEEFIALMKEPQAADEFIPGYKLGDLGPVYGSQWRNWFGERWPDGEHIVVDQILNLVKDLKENPSSRRHILTAWNPVHLEEMALPPCHVLSQFTVTNDGSLWCHMYQRSCDMFLGVPFNIASYSLLTYMLSQVTGLKPGGLIHTMHDAHIYVNHMNAVVEQLSRTPREFPKLMLSPGVDDIDRFVFGDIVLIDYNPYDAIKAELNT